MKARQLFRYKERQDDLAVEMVIWKLPGRTRERSHGLEYRLYCGRGGECIVREALINRLRRHCERSEAIQNACHSTLSGLPQSVAPRNDSINQSFVIYDREAGQGDHSRYGDREEPYVFTSVGKLLEDFRQDCARLAGWKWR